MRPIRLLSVLLCAAAFCCGTAAGTEPDRIRIACYNVESLFDTVPDPSAGDAEFTPHSPRRWNTERYRMKINHISRVIDDLDADAWKALNMRTRYYTARLHVGAFYLPAFLEEMLREVEEH